MTVPKRQINGWKLLREDGDITAIHNESGISRMALTRAFKGKASEGTVRAIQKYYDKKKQSA